MVSQFAPEPVKEIVHGEVDCLGPYGAHFDLIDVEQRIQHAGHGAQRFIDAGDQFLSPLPDDLLGQQTLEQREGLHRLPQIVACRRRESAIWRCWPIPPPVWRR